MSMSHHEPEIAGKPHSLSPAREGGDKIRQVKDEGLFSSHKVCTLFFERFNRPVREI